MDKCAFRIRDFCRAYGIGRTKVYDEFKLGRLKFFKVDRVTLISKEAAENWLKAREAEPLSPSQASKGRRKLK